MLADIGLLRRKTHDVLPTTLRGTGRQLHEIGTCQLQAQRAFINGDSLDTRHQGEYHGKWLVNRQYASKRICLAICDTAEQRGVSHGHVAEVTNTGQNRRQAPVRSQDLISQVRKNRSTHLQYSCTLPGYDLIMAPMSHVGGMDLRSEGKEIRLIRF